MKTTDTRMADAVLEQMEREAPRTRRVLEQVPEGRDEWKPHDKSMALGRLANLVAGIPSWVAMIVGQEELDVMPKSGPSSEFSKQAKTRAELVEAHEKAMDQARAALRDATDERLMKTWKLLAAGKVVAEDPRHTVLQDMLMHLAPPGPAHRLSQAERSDGSVGLRADGGRSQIRVASGRAGVWLRAGADPRLSAGGCGTLPGHRGQRAGVLAAGQVSQGANGGP
jgi:hypothetical protein